jgi:hypothetical protein
MLRVLHFFFPSGGCTTWVITWRTLSPGSHGFRPRPGRSFRPSNPCSSKRRDQVDTVVILTPTAPLRSERYTTAQIFWPVKRKVA